VAEVAAAALVALADEASVGELVRAKGTGVAEMLFVLLLVLAEALAAIEASRAWIEVGETVLRAPVPLAWGPDPAVRLEPAALLVET
jgi:hypothetical protein